MNVTTDHASIPQQQVIVPPEERPSAGRRRRALARARRGIRQPGVYLALISFFLTLLWMAAVRPFAAPDEPAHLQAVMQVRKFHILPEVHYAFDTDPPGSVVNTPLDPATQAYIVDRGFGEGPRLVPNESFHPPLYHLTVALAALPLPDDPRTTLYIGRIVTALFGAFTVYFCWAAVRQIAPQAPLWAAATAGAITLLPQFCFNRAVVSNDTAVNCLAAAAFYVWFRGLRDPAYDTWLVRAGVVGGLAVLAGLNGAMLLPGLGLVILFRAWRAGSGPNRWRTRLRQGLRMVAGAGVAGVGIAGWWFVRNLVVYGEPTGLLNVVQYAHVTYPILDFRDPATRDQFVNSTWDSFWGLFGWMTSRMPDDFYTQTRWVAALTLSLSVLAGGVALARALIRHRRVPAVAWQAALILALTTGALLTSYVQFSINVAFQAQGRLLFLALLPAGLVFTGGIHALAPGRWGKIIGLSLLLGWLGLMNMVALAVTALT